MALKTRKQLRAAVGDKWEILYGELEKIRDGIVDVLGNGDTDETRMEGMYTSRDASNTSMYRPVVAANSTPYGFRTASSIDYAGGMTGGYFNQLFANARVTTTPTGTVRGIEGKATVYQGDMGNGSYAEGILGKVTVQSSPAQVDYGVGVHAYVENGGANTSITNAYGVLAEAASPLSKTLSSAFAAKDIAGGVWMYGLDTSGCTGLTADIRGQNGETIKNTTNGVWDFGAGKVIGTGNYGKGAGMSTPILNDVFGSPTSLGAGFRAVYTSTPDGSVYFVGTTEVNGWFAAAASPVAGS
jgi:hypothetical protein